VIYHSRYEEPALDHLAQAFARHRQAGRQVWCIFDNTASGAAMPDALSLLARTGSARPARSASSVSGGGS
jgi:uncharacterized protein YecE (DUF72 family)